MTLTLIDKLLLAFTFAAGYVFYLGVVYLILDWYRVRRLRRVRHKAATVSERTEPVVVRVDRNTFRVIQ